MAITRVRWKRGTAADWTGANPVLRLGEPGWETDTRTGKVGDGVTDWSSLPYSLGAGTGGGGGGGIDTTAIHAATSKTPPVDADELPLLDSANAYGLKKLLMSNLSLYVAGKIATLSQTLTNKNLTSGTNIFPTFNQNTTGSAGTLSPGRNIDGVAFNGSADVAVVAPATHAATAKTVPAAADELVIIDSAASFALKKITYANLKADFTSTVPDNFSDLLGTVSLAQMAPDATFAVIWVTNHWERKSAPGTSVTTRPTTRTDVTMIAIGGTSAPAFAISGDLWLEDNS